MDSDGPPHAKTDTHTWKVFSLNYIHSHEEKKRCTGQQKAVKSVRVASVFYPIYPTFQHSCVIGLECWGRCSQALILFLFFLYWAFIRKIEHFPQAKEDFIYSNLQRAVINAVVSSNVSMCQKVSSVQPWNSLINQPVSHCFSHCWRSKKMWSRARVSWGRSSLLAGYILAQWAVPEYRKYVNIRLLGGKNKTEQVEMINYCY